MFVLLTIFTPTYNRAHLLPRLYSSLISQDNQSFEWLIVDDGSEDNTEFYVSRMTAENKVKIRYIKKENGGKHTAHNVAIKAAYGDWFLCLDSDDILAPNAVENICSMLQHTKNIAGLVAYKAQMDGSLLCRRIPESFSSDHSLYEYALAGGGEYTLIFSTEILRKYPFPVIEGECFSSECVVYDQLDLAGYTFGLIPSVLEICEYQTDGLSSAVYQTMFKNPTGYQIYHAQRINLVTSFKARLRHAVSYQAFRALSKNNTYLYHGQHKLLVLMAWLPGQLGAIYYKKKGTC